MEVVDGSVDWAGQLTFVAVVEAAGRVMEGAGVAIIVVGAALASLRFLDERRRGGGRYRAYRTGLGQAILLGLEFLVAGDIIRTVAVEPSFRSVGVLAIIVAIRTFLSLSLQLEIDGRWPWQTAAAIGYRLPATGSDRSHPTAPSEPTETKSEAADAAASGARSTTDS